MEEDIITSEDGEINRYHFRKRPSSQMENMKRSICIKRKKSKGSNRAANRVAPTIFKEESQDYTEEELNCDIIIKDEPLFELDEEEVIHEEEEMDNSQNYFEEVSMEPPMLSDACDDTMLDEESDPLCCGSAFPPSVYTNSPNDIQLETLDGCDMVYKDPLTLNTLKTSNYSQTFFIKKEKDTEKVICVKKEEEEDDIDNDNKEQILRNELSETSLDLPLNSADDNKLKLEFNNEQNWGKIAEFNCSSLFNIDATDQDTVDSMEYVSCQSIEHKNIPKPLKSVELNSAVDLNKMQSAQVLCNNLLKQLSSTTTLDLNKRYVMVQGNKNSEYSLKILTDNDNPNPCANSQMISKIALEVSESFKNRLDVNIKSYKQQQNCILVSEMENKKLINSGRIVATTSQNKASKVQLNSYVIKNTTGTLPNLPTSVFNMASSSQSSGTFQWLNSNLNDKLIKSSTMESLDKMPSPVNATEDHSINQHITLDQSRQMPKIWVNRDITNLFNNSSQETEHLVKEKEQRTIISEATDQRILPTIYEQNLVQSNIPAVTYVLNNPQPLVKVKENKLESQYSPGTGIIQYVDEKKEEKEEKPMWKIFVNNKQELAASNWVPVEGRKDGNYTLYTKLEDGIQSTLRPKIMSTIEENSLVDSSLVDSISNKNSVIIPVLSKSSITVPILNKSNDIKPILNENNVKNSLLIANLVSNPILDENFAANSITNKKVIIDPIIKEDIDKKTPAKSIKHSVPIIINTPQQTSKKPRKQKLVPKAEDIVEIKKVHKSRKQQLQVNYDIVSKDDEMCYVSCTSCRKTFPNIDHYNMHTEVYHDNANLRKCKLCKEICETFCDLYSHYIYHTTVDKVNYCSLTSFDFMNPKNQLLDYIKLYNHREPGTFICFCGLIYDFRSRLISHVDKKYSSCKKLSLHIINRATLDIHCSDAKEKRRYTKKALRTRGKYIINRPKSNVPPKCRVCKLEFDNRRVYLEHIRFEHIQTYFCENCPYEITCKKLLQRHMISSHYKSKITACTTKLK